jgi:hypothetical protein
MNFKKSMVAVALLSAFASVQAANVEGSTVGTWTNPLPGSATTTGEGTSMFTWGQGVGGSDPSSLSFTSNSFASALETPFKVGSVKYFNGSIFSAADSVQLALNLNFTQPGLGPVISNYGFQLINTDNTSDLDASADFVKLPSAFSNTSFLIGATEYRVKLVGFQNIVGDGFLVSNPLQFHVREQGSASADLFAVVTTQPVPEPSTYALMLAGLLGMGYIARRRQQQQQ